jgi:hypothetical protein
MLAIGLAAPGCGGQVSQSPDEDATTSGVDSGDRDATGSIEAPPDAGALIGNDGTVPTPPPFVPDASTDGPCFGLGSTCVSDSECCQFAPAGTSCLPEAHAAYCVLNHQQ